LFYICFILICKYSLSKCHYHSHFIFRNFHVLECYLMCTICYFMLQYLLFYNVTWHQKARLYDVHCYAVATIITRISVGKNT
jgi:hypothetical protein